MELVTGFQGKNHVSGLAVGDKTVVLKTQDQLPAEVLTANSVRIGTGDIIAGDGGFFTNEAPEELTIENGVTGLNRNDLIVARYQKADPAVDEDGNPDYTIPRVESGTFAVVKGTPSSGTPADPTVDEASIHDDSTTLADFPVYRLPIRGLSVGTPEPLFTLLDPSKEAWDSLSQNIKDAEKDISALKTRINNNSIAATRTGSKAYSLGANATGSVSISIAALSDGSPCLSGYDTGNISVLPVSINHNGTTTCTATLRNISGSAVSGTLSVRYLFVRPKLP